MESLLLGFFLIRLDKVQLNGHDGIVLPWQVPADTVAPYSLFPSSMKLGDTFSSNNPANVICYLLVLLSLSIICC